MAAKPSNSVDLSKFTDAIKQLSSLSGKDLATTLKAETGKVLETAVRYTPKADREKIKEQVTAHINRRAERGDVKNDNGFYYETMRDGKEWFRPEQGEDRDKWFLIMGWKVPDRVWSAFQATISAVKDLKKSIDERVKAALARRGLTQKTWVQIGQAIGVQVNAPSYVAKANTPAGLGTATVKTDRDSATVSGANDSRVLTVTRTGQGIINRAIKARAAYAEKAIEKGALDTLKGRARAYPALFKEAA